MKFTRTPVSGGFVVEPQPHVDDRGSFARLWCNDEAAAQGLETRFVQVNGSYNARRGTLRGLHYQASPHEEVKLVRCVRGAIFDVFVDLRPTSPTHLRWFGAELTSRNGAMLYVPTGCAHGYVTLEDDSEVHYMVSHPYRREAEKGARWNDPAFAIAWPITEDLLISEKDAQWPDYRQ